MQFRLVYQGKLPAASYSGGGTRTKEKHDIRRQLHLQLRLLWGTYPFLKRRMFPTLHFGTPHFTEEEKRRLLEDFHKRPTPVSLMADNYARCGYRFLPLIGNAFGSDTGVACAIDILFLRRDEPGALVQGGGDIDNRIKTLFDALRMPQSCDEIKGFAPGEGEDPFFCLLEDDKLITEVKVTTDRLLTPLATDAHMHDVHLVIHVRTLTVGANDDRTAFLT